MDEDQQQQHRNAKNSREEPCRLSFRDGRLASRKAEEAALRRFQAIDWLESLIGPLGLSDHPTDKEFISCLRSGLVLCNAINKVQPGAVPKVVISTPSKENAWDIQPLPAYQYFENVRNFLVAMAELKLPGFEASDLDRDNIDVASAAKVVDCVLALKAFHEYRSGDKSGGKIVKSPLALQPVGRVSSTDSASANKRRLDMASVAAEEQQSNSNENAHKEDPMDTLARLLADKMFNSKENFDHKLVATGLSSEGKGEPVQLFKKIMSICLQEKRVEPIVKDASLEEDDPSSLSTAQSERVNGLALGEVEHGSLCHLAAQEREIEELKDLLSSTKTDFITLQTQLQNDFALLDMEVQGLYSAASGYQQAVRENRKLYNTIQELRGNIRVFCRVRPCNSQAKSCIDYIGNDGSLIVSDPFKLQNGCKEFQFNEVFGPHATQDEVYKGTQGLIRSVMDGYNVCIFAYGQTGSGKTYTMCGPPSGTNKEAGINYMALNDLFQLSNARENMRYEIRVQMVEIYNEQVRDLLDQDSSNTKLEIRNCSSNGCLPDAKMQIVQSTSDVLDLMKLGERNRAFSSTAMNDRSSRSHSVLTVHVFGEDISGSTIRSCLHLVDLAGSERVDKSEVTGDRLREAQHINKSLSCLGDVITALAQKNSHIPYRNSKLTQLLQNSLGGNAKMLMFAHVSPEALSYGETLSTLKFAQKASTVELGCAQSNKESTEVRELKEQINTLKKALAVKEAEKYSQRLKENTPGVERPKQIIDRTPPRPRRLSIENDNNPKNILAVNPEDNKKMLKSPIPRPKLATTDLTALCKRRLSSEGSTPAMNRTEPEPVLSDFLTACPDRLGGNKQGEPNLNLEKPNDSLPGSRSSYTETRLSKIGKLSGLYHRQQLKSPVHTINYVEVTPDKTTNAQTKSNVRNSANLSNHSSTRSVQIRKSLMSFGKLINGSEKRNMQYLKETPSSKFSANNKIDAKSPPAIDSRTRRQSLTTVEALGSTGSRRTSLGGKSVDSSNIVQNAKTPPPVYHSSGKAIKR